MTAALAEATVDAFLGGRVEALQPARGHHRAGLDAILLAAALGPETEGAVFDLGAGVGVAGMAVAARCARTRVTLVEREPELAALALTALARPANRAFDDRVRVVEADLLSAASRAAAGLADGSADHVVMNPPYYPPAAVRASPEAGRAGAHVLAEGGVDAWFRAAAALVAPGGTATAIFRADGIAELFAAASGRFGAAILLPVHPREGEPASRLIVRATKGSRGRPALLPGLVLHGEAGSAFLPGPSAVLREGAALAEIHGAWGRALR